MVATTAVTVVCVGGLARDVSYRCPRCRVRRLLAAASQSLSMLHAAGVEAVAHGAGRDEDDGQEVTAARQVLSLRVLLDQPDFLSRMDRTDSVAEAKPEGPTPNPR